MCKFDSFPKSVLSSNWPQFFKIAKIDARNSQIDQFVVVTAQPRLGTSSFTTSRVEGTNFFFILQTLPRMSAGQEDFLSSARNIVSKRYWRCSLSNSVI